MLENVDDPAVMVEPLNDNCTDVLLVLNSDVKKAVEYAEKRKEASKKKTQRMRKQKNEST